MDNYQIKCSCGCDTLFGVAPTVISGKVFCVTLEAGNEEDGFQGVVIEDPKILDGLIEYLTMVLRGVEGVS